ncbi:RecX family transcriptional regulator [bacterium]|nr:RecX family transcriptional regulator [bacterium]
MDEITSKLMRYCVYQERCRKEVTEKLREWDLEDEDKEDIITFLEEEGFLNEDRFARAFAGGKFRVKRWGRMKIRRELQKKGLDEATIAAGIQVEIPEEDYWQAAGEWIEKKAGSITGKSSFERKGKLSRFLLQKGFEWDVIHEVLKEKGFE